MRKEITEDQIAQLLAGIPRAEEVDRLKAEVARLTRERDEARAEVARMMKLHTPPADIPWQARDLRALPYQTAAGCMCPAEANLHCQNSFCPRRNPPGVITCQGGKP